MFTTQKTATHNHFPAKKWESPDSVVSDIDVIVVLKANGYNTDQIATAASRTSESINNKSKSFSTKTIGSNTAGIKGKYETNDIFLSQIKPKSILDLHAGKHSYYDPYSSINNTKLITNDKKYKGHTYKGDAGKVASLLYGQGESFDIVDIDPFGSAYSCFMSGIQMADKALIITFGDIKNAIQYRNIQTYGPRYSVLEIEELTISKILNEVNRIASICKKVLTIKHHLTTGKMHRIYFEVKPAPKQNPLKVVNKKPKKVRSILNEYKSVRYNFQKGVLDVKVIAKKLNLDVNIVKQCKVEFLKKLGDKDPNQLQSMFEETRKKIESGQIEIPKVSDNQDFVNRYIRTKNK
jgi:hypothetical protein